MTILSPLTLRQNTTKVLHIKTEEIVRLYKKDYNIDVGSYFENLDFIEIYKCSETGLMFYYPSVVGDGNFYEQLHHLGWYYPSWKWEHHCVSSYIQPNTSVLEIGCGDGHFLSRVKVEKSISATGIEINKKAIINAEKKGVHIINETVENYSKTTTEKFDVVCCFQVLEHIPNTYEFIESCISLLRPNGILAFAVPNNNPYLYGYDVFHTLNLPPHHQSLWNKQAFSQLSMIFPKIQLVHLEAEPIDANQFGAYMFHYKNFFKKEKLSYFVIKNFLPKLFWTRIAKLMHIEGRNLVAVYKKLN
jgi:2-polyprenyl-3-methyl-5-hydroxy-6-metoxy-1,4-benzoquinol methylase